MSIQLSVFSDEVSQDFERACQLASGEFGLGFGLVDCRIGCSIHDDVWVMSRQEISQV